jgi:8-amino-7-oxononanoate synthase
MSDLFSKFDDIIAQKQSLIDAGYRDPIGLIMDKVLSPTEAIISGKDTILCGTYNYMGMTFDPDVIDAGMRAMRDYGTGTNGSRCLNGTFADHIDAEEALKEFYGTDHAMVFSTGYQANLGFVSALIGKNDYVIIDADSHASIYDGCFMAVGMVGANLVRFRHNSVKHLEQRLSKLPKDAHKLVVLEGVYSMLGDIAPLTELVAVAKKYGAMVLVDEAHSMGFFGEHGRGVYEEQGLDGEVDFVVGTFSKSVGTVGGFVVSNHPKFDILRFFSRPYMFTASLPPSVVATAAASIRKLMFAHNKRQHLWANIRALHGGLKELGFRLGTETPESGIISVLLEDQEQAVAMWDKMIDLGVYVNMARPPATPAGVFLLRCSLCAEHTQEQIDTVLERFAIAGRMVGAIS